MSSFSCLRSKGSVVNQLSMRMSFAAMPASNLWIMLSCGSGHTHGKKQQEPPPIESRIAEKAVKGILGDGVLMLSYEKIWD